MTTERAEVERSVRPNLTGILVAGWARISDEDREAYLGLVKEVIEASAIRRGCLQFSVSEDISERNLFHLTERWADLESLDESRFGAENAAMLQRFAGLAVRDREVSVYTVSSVDPG